MLYWYQASRNDRQQIQSAGGKMNTERLSYEERLEQASDTFEQLKEANNWEFRAMNDPLRKESLIGSDELAGALFKADVLSNPEITPEPTDNRVIAYDPKLGAIPGGNGIDPLIGIVLSQIVYWTIRPDKNGNTKLRVIHDKKLWLAKSMSDWEQETGITATTVRRKIAQIEDSGLITTALFKFNGRPTLHIRPTQQLINRIANRY